MFSEPYSSRVLELAADIPLAGDLPVDLPQAQGAATKVSRLCGSVVSIALDLEDGTVARCVIDPKACALGQASASVLARGILGASFDEVRAGRDALRAMLKDNASPPEGRFWELRHLAAVADYPARHASTLLAFEAAVDAFTVAIQATSERAI
jgi:NifU-like protein involved in Fe-S cluster formation